MESDCGIGDEVQKRTYHPAAVDKVLDSTKGVSTHGLGSSCFKKADIARGVLR